MTGEATGWPHMRKVQVASLCHLGLRHLLPVQLAIQEKCAKLVQKHFQDLWVIPPQNCVKIVRAQLLHNFCAKNGARAQFWHIFSGSPGTKKNVSRAQFYTIFSARCNFLKICGCTGQRCLNPTYERACTYTESQTLDEASKPRNASSICLGWTMLKETAWLFKDHEDRQNHQRQFVLLSLDKMQNSAACHGRTSTPNMTGRRFHRTTEATPPPPWKAKRSFDSRPIKACIN